MGVRGLTTFIAQNQNRYLKRFELHDTYLVIDGNNLAAQLYKWHGKCYDCFGGDYDKYAQSIMHFFNLLQECNVTPLVVFDGGYEDKKLKTIYSRIKTRIRQAKVLNSANENSMTVFPLFLRELFVNVLLKLNIKVVRCLVEADLEMACISRKLKCPVLSYDSDFYIFDVEYIPFNTLMLISIKSSSRIGCLPYKYLDCQIYRIDHFLEVYKGLQRECVPLLGVLLGNDYIKISIFSNFYRHLKKARSKPGHSDQQRRIKSLITWLQTETFDSAIRKVLGRTKLIYRNKVAKEIQSVANNYLCSDSHLLKYFNLNISENEKPSQNKTVSSTVNINVSEIEVDEASDLNDSENENDEENESEVDVLIEEQPEESKLLNLPLYFEEKYKNCLYPACFIDIKVHNRYFFIPLIEDYYKPQCHVISLNILAAIASILNGNDSKDLKYILRSEHGRMESYLLPYSNKALPNLIELEQISQKQATTYISSVLEIHDDKFFQELQEFPASWRLFVISIIYWIKNADSTVNECYIDALLLSGIILKSIGVEFPRNQAKFLRKFHKDVEYLERHPVRLSTPSDKTIKSILDTITEDDKIILMKELVINFDMIFRLRRNSKLFNCGIVHVFAQFQSCAYHIKFLNSLLNSPFEDYPIADFYNGTLLYNLTTNFLSRPQLDGYLQHLMRNSPNIYNAFIAIKEFFKEHLPNVCRKNILSKRKRKRRKKTVQAVIETESVSSDEDEDVYDINNRFSALKKLDGH